MIFPDSRLAMYNSTPGLMWSSVECGTIVYRTRNNRLSTAIRSSFDRQTLPNYPHLVEKIYKGIKRLLTLVWLVPIQCLFLTVSSIAASMFLVFIKDIK